MSLRIQLISTTLGSLTIRKGDPVDINAVTSTLKRSKTNDGVIRQVTIDLQFIKAGRSFLKRAFETTGGPDAIVICNVYRLDANARQYVMYFSGQVNFSNYEVTETTITVDVEQTGFQRLVENSLTVPVDLETLVDVFGNPLPANATVELPLHAKAIQSIFQKTGTEEFLDSDIDDDPSLYFVPGTGLGSFQNDETKYIEEIQDCFSLESGILSEIPTASKVFFIKCVIGGEYRLQSNLSFTFANNGGIKTITNVQFKFVYGQQNGYTSVNIGTPESGPPGFGVVGIKEVDVTVSLVPDDEIYFFASFEISGGGGPSQIVFSVASNDYPNKSLIKVTALTKLAPSIAKTVLMHEAVKRTVQFYTGQEDCFESTLLGRIDLGYAEDGQGSLVANTNGNNIRLRPKAISHSLQSLIAINNALYGIGVGYKTVDGVQKLLLEKKSFFYNKNLRALSLGKVYNVRRRLDINRLYNQIRFGFNSKIDLDQINATDAFNTIRDYVLPLRNSKNKLDFSTDVKADGYQIEYQRGYINSTKDAKLDDENFIIQAIRDGLGYKAKKDEGYNLITGVIDPASGYNYDLAPARCVRNWLQYLASSLVYSNDKVAKFAAGSVNYELSTQKTGEDLIKENDPVSLFGIEPLYKPFVLEFETEKLSCADFEELVTKAEGYIEFEDNFGATYNGFIDDEVTHNPTTLATTFNLLEVFR